MAATFAVAFAEVAEALDQALYSRPPIKRRAPDERLEAAFAEVNYARLLAQMRRRARERGRNPSEGEEALQEELASTMEKRPSEFQVAGWEKRIIVRASFRLLEGDDVRRPVSFSVLEGGSGENALATAEPCVPPSPESDESARYAALPGPGEAWTPTQILSALQRFRDYYGHPPRVVDCRASNRLPCYSTIRRHFGSLEEALLAAGMVPNQLGRRRKRWPVLEAARACRWHKRRHGDWPNWRDLRRYPGILPSSSVMIRCFGSTRPSEVGRVAAAILAQDECST